MPLRMFNDSCADGLRHLLRSAAGCRWAIAQWEKLEKMLAEDGTWYGADRIEAIQLQGLSACVDHLYALEESVPDLARLPGLPAQPQTKGHRSNS